MVKIVTKYECSYCGSVYSLAEDARKCSEKCQQQHSPDHIPVSLVTYRLTYDPLNSSTIMSYDKYTTPYYVATNDSTNIYNHMGECVGKLNEVEVSVYHHHKAEITLIADNVKPEDVPAIRTKLKHALYHSCRDISDIIWAEIMEDQENDKGKSENLS